MTIKNLGSNFRLPSFPERISVQHAVMTYFEKRAVSLSWSLGNAGRGRDGEWLINLYKNGPHAGIFFPFCTNPVWHLSQEKYETTAICAEPASADFQTYEELTQIIFCSFIFISTSFSFPASSFWHILFPPSVCPGKIGACAARIIPTRLNGNREDICTIWFKARSLWLEGKGMEEVGEG